LVLTAIIFGRFLWRSSMAVIFGGQFFHFRQEFLWQWWSIGWLHFGLNHWVKQLWR